MNQLSRLRSMLHSLWAASIRRQLAWAFGLALALMTLVSLSFLLAFQRNFLYRQSTEHAFGLTKALAASSVSWVLANDVAGLQEVVDGLSATPDLKFAAVLSLHGEVLASTRREQVGFFSRRTKPEAVAGGAFSADRDGTAASA